MFLLLLAILAVVAVVVAVAGRGAARPAVHGPAAAVGLRFGSELINSDGAAAGSIVVGVLFDGASVLILFAAYKLGHGWLQRRRQATSLVPS